MDGHEQIGQLYEGLDCNAQWDVFCEIFVELGTESERNSFMHVSGFYSIAVFAKLHLPHVCRLPFGRHHTAFFNALQRGDRGKRVNILAPRNSAKSTCMAVLYPLHCVYYKEMYQDLGMPHDNYILIISKSSKVSSKRVKDIKSYIESTPSLVHLKDNVIWGAEEIETSNKCLISARGRGGQVRGVLYLGYRPSLVIPDDLDDIESITNPDTLTKDLDWFNTDLLECGDKNTNIIMVDTVKASNAIANQLRYDPTWETHFIQAVIEPPNLRHPEHEDLWSEYSKIFMNNSIPPAERKQQITEFYDANSVLMHAGVVETWGDQWTYRDIREKEFSQGRNYILREYQNTPIDQELAIFDWENRVTYDFEQMKRSDDRYIHPWIGATCYLDYAGVKDSIDNCYAFCVTILWERAYDTKPNGYVFDVQYCRGSRDKQLTMLVDAYEKVRPHTEQVRVVTEDVVDPLGDIKLNFQRVWGDIMERRGLQLHLEFHSKHKDKIERITALEGPINNGRLCFPEDLPEEYADQMGDFPLHPFLDGPDATEGAWDCPVLASAQELTERREFRNRMIEESNMIEV